MKAALRNIAKVAVGWIDEDISPVVDLIWSFVILLITAGFIGALVPYAPAVLFGDHLAQSAGTYLAYQCISGPTCDYYSLMGGLALGLYVSAVVMVVLLLPFWRWLDWKDAERELAQEEAADAASEEEAEADAVHANGRRVIGLSGSERLAE